VEVDMADNALVFQVGESFAFTAQIPDATVGDSGSRCASCYTPTVCSAQICRQCKLPFVGPNGFPQMKDWLELKFLQMHDLIVNVFEHGYNRGRIQCVNVAYVPITKEELLEVEKLNNNDALCFEQTHGIAPKQLREILIK
jgi:hypothetical protein